MKICTSRARLSVLSLALAAAFPVAAQTASKPPQLKETVVTATRFAEPAASLPIGVSVLTADEIRASGASSVSEAIIRLLGVAGRQDLLGSGDYSLDLRGFGATADSNQVIVVDGQRLNEADTGGTRLAGIPIDTVERIEVLRGSGAVLYGEGASGGVIVITTKAGLGMERRNSASVYGGLGSLGLRDLRASATLASGGFSLDLSGQKRQADNHRDNFRSDADAASVSAQWSNDWLRLGVRHARDTLDTGLPGSLTTAQYAANPRQATKPTDHANIKNERNGLFAQAQIGDWHVAADAGWRDKNLRSSFSGYPFDFDIHASDYSLRAQNEMTVGVGKNILVLGTDHGSWTREILGFFGSTAHRSSRALYLKDDLILSGSGTRLSVGLRTERIEKDDSSTTALLAKRQRAWELGLSQPLTTQFMVFGRTGRSYRLPSVDEFSFTTPGLILEPQISHDFELGGRWNYAEGKAELRAYRSRLSHEIGFDPNAVGPFSPFSNGANVNFDPTRRQGLEFDATHALTKTLGLRLNAGLRQSRFRSGPYAGNDVPLVPSRTLAVRADWQPMAGHRVSGGVNWVSSQHPDFNNQCSMPSHATADLRYAYSWQQVELSLGVGNLFDRKYFTQAFGCASGMTTSIYPEPGRTFAAALRLRF